MGDGVCLIELVLIDGQPIDGRYLEVNAAFERMTGLKNAVGRTFQELGPPGYERWLELVSQAAASGGAKGVVHELAQGTLALEVEAYRIGADKPQRIGLIVRDVTRNRGTGVDIRDSQKLAYLLRLSDALLPLTGADDIQSTAAGLLAVQLGAGRVFFATIEGDAEYHVVAEYTDGLPGHLGRHPLSASQRRWLPHWRNGHLSSVVDSEADITFSDEDRATYASLGTRSAIEVPLLRGGQLVAILAVHHAKNHEWTDAEIGLICQTAERGWAAVERARAEADLRESEARFREFGEKSSDVLWITDLETMKLEYLSPAFERIWGEERDMVMANSSRWAEMVHPDDLAQAARALPRLMSGEAAVSDYRIVRADGEVRFIRDTGFPMHRNGKVTRGGGIARDVTDVRLAEQRQRILVAELQHRVRNILTVVRSVFQRTAETTVDPDEMANHFRGRLDAMARTQVMAARSAARSIDLEDLIRDELLSVGIGDGPVFRIAGPAVALPFETAELIALAVHELTTNSLKYGALKAKRGRLDVRWETNLSYGGACKLDLIWEESGVPAVPIAPSRRGFGRELVEEALPYRLGAETKLEFRGNGVRCSISVELPSERLVP